jgi:threonine dehydratase
MPRSGSSSPPAGMPAWSTRTPRRQLGVPATAFVPAAAPEVKVQRIAEYGAQVHRIGTEYAEAYQAAVSFAREHGALFCHAYDQVEIAAGAGTIAEGLLEDGPGVEVIVVAVGGGGLFAGVAAAAAGRAQVVAVEPRRHLNVAPGPRPWRAGRRQRLRSRSLTHSAPAG